MNSIPDFPPGSPIFLIGYMGAGKTTFGRALARATGRQFIDLDFYISQRFHATVSELFASRGEAAFRTIESAMLREAGEFENVVVACGGGTPCHGDNMDYMLGRGFTVLLETSRERLIERLLAGGDRRPLVAGKNRGELERFIDAHLTQREPFYSRAHVRFESGRLENVRQIDRTTAEFLKKFTLFCPT